MPQFTGSLSTFSPTTGVANAILENVSGTSSLIKDLTFGGQLTTSTAMQTRLARDSAVGTGSRTGGNVQKGDPHNGAQGAFFSTTYGTLQPTVVAGWLWGTSWNAHGGVVRFLADPLEVFLAYDAAAANASIELRSDVGTGTSSYSLTWMEN